MGEPWWKSAVVYQIYPRSFAPSGIGTDARVGDLGGITKRIDYLSWLGVDAIWLSPFYPSPMADFGYDVANYCDVDPLFGTIDDFDALLSTAHKAGIKVLIDWVPNHTSNQHPWFLESRSSRNSAKRDWYVWRDGSPDTPPNGWKAAFTGGDPAWTWDDATEQWYLHLFLPEQPDLNWANPEVVDAMHGTLRFWLDRGVDGFRVDVVHLLGKDINREGSGRAIGDTPLTHEILRDIRKLVDSYPGDRMMVGEVYILDTSRVARFYGDGDELHLSFNFPPLHAAWDAAVMRSHIDAAVTHFDPRDAWPTWVLSSHDSKRHRTRYGSEARARAAAVFVLTLRGTPFVFAGEELGLEDAAIPPERVVDPGGRDGCRAPLPWTPDADHGWGITDPWLPWPPDASRRNADSLSADPSSILHLYRRALAERRASPALQLGSWTPLPGPDGVLAYRRDHGDDTRVVLINFTAQPQPVAAPDGMRVVVASDGMGEGEPYGGTLGPDGAVVLK